MKKLLLAALAVCFALSANPTRIFAQQSGTKPVVVLDVGKVFDSHIRFKRDIELMRKEALDYQSSLQQIDSQLKTIVTQMQEHKAGTPEYNRLDEEATRLRSEAQIDSQLKKKDFSLREAKVYYQYYTELQKFVQQFAEKHGVSLVLRWNSSPIDKDNRASVQQGVVNSVVYQRSLDITQLMIDEVNRGVPPEQGTADTRNGPLLPGRR